MSKVTPFLMFNDQLEAALDFYVKTFPDSEVKTRSRAGKDGPLTSAQFIVGGQAFMGFNGGAYFSFSEGVSLYVDCADQAEVDGYWEKILAAGGVRRSVAGSRIPSAFRGRSCRGALSSCSATRTRGRCKPWSPR